MTVKQFLKSKTFSALLVLLCIALVAGGLLAVLNDVLAISDSDRIKSAIESIYGEPVDYTETELSGELRTNEYGEVINIYLLSDGNYLIKSMGKDGYKNGTVTLWLVAEYADDEFVGLGSIAVAGNEKQTLMGDFKAKYFNIFTSADVLNDNYFTIEGTGESIKQVKSGATFTSRAVNNAVNACLFYIRGKGGSL